MLFVACSLFVEPLWDAARWKPGSWCKRWEDTSIWSTLNIQIPLEVRCFWSECILVFKYLLSFGVWCLGVSRIDGIPTERSLGYFKKDSLEFRGGGWVGQISLHNITEPIDGILQTGDYFDQHLPFTRDKSSDFVQSLRPLRSCPKERCFMKHVCLGLHPWWGMRIMLDQKVIALKCLKWWLCYVLFVVSFCLWEASNLTCDMLLEKFGWTTGMIWKNRTDGFSF